MEDREVDIRNDLEIDDDEEEDTGEPRYEPLYEAVKNIFSVEELQYILSQAPEEAKHGVELFKLIKFALLETEATHQHVKLLIEQDPTCARIRHEESGDYLLHLACLSDCETSRVETIRLLLELNPEAAKARDKEGYIPLHHAAYMEEMPVEAILILLDTYPEGASVVVSSLGELPIHMAAVRWKYMTVEIMQRIVELYPEGIRAQDNAGQLPLHYACRLARVEVIQYLGTLYPKGASVRDNKGHLPLHLANEHRTHPLAVMQFLLELHSDGVHAVDSAGMLPLHHTCGYQESLGSNLLRDVYYERDIRHVPMEKRNRRYTDEYEDIIHLLIRLYPDGLRLRDNRGRLPLHHACLASVSLRMLQTLLARNPQDNAAVDNVGFLPLHCSCIIPKSFQNIRFLAERDPFSVLKTTQNGETPLQLSREYIDDFEDGVFSLEEIQEFLALRQVDAEQAIRSSMVSTCEEIGLPDLVVAKIWSFAKPNLWRLRQE